MKAHNKKREKLNSKQTISKTLKKITKKIFKRIKTGKLKIDLTKIDKKKLIKIIPFICVLFVAIALVVFFNKKKEEEDYKFGTILVENNLGFKYIPNEDGIPIAQIDVDLADLKKINPDVCAWIYVPDTAVSCPVVCNPTNPDYYGEKEIKGFPGVFIQNYNNTNFSDRMTVVYGKERDGVSQFAGLFKFKDRDFYDKHKYLYIYTGDRILTYRIFAAYRDYARHLMLGYDWSVDPIFIDYLIDVENGSDADKNANIDSDEEITIYDKVITLSEKIEKEVNYRYLIQGVLVDETEINATPVEVEEQAE